MYASLCLQVKLYMLKYRLQNETHIYHNRTTITYTLRGDKVSILTHTWGFSFRNPDIDHLVNSGGLSVKSGACHSTWAWKWGRFQK